MQRRAYVRSAEAESELNLVPIMNLVVCLIPMVLFGASFVQLGVVNVNASKFGPAIPSPNPPAEPPVTITLGIGAHGFSIQGDRPLDDAGEQAPIEIPRLETGLDLNALYSVMHQLRARFPEANPLVLTADADVPYADIIRVMDAVRLKLEADQYPTVAEFRAAQAATGPDALLWPDVVLSHAN
ncbi:MAG: ExbD/TolR family protein [Bradymonadia bacterium]